MLNVYNTLSKTIYKKIRDLRFLGKYNRLEFKQILSLIIVNDMLEWAESVSEKQSVQKALQDWIACHVSKLCFYDKSYDNKCMYTNVNIPSTNNDWKILEDIAFQTIAYTSSCSHEKLDGYSKKFHAYAGSLEELTEAFNTFTREQKNDIYMTEDNKFYMYDFDHCQLVQFNPEVTSNQISDISNTVVNELLNKLNVGLTLNQDSDEWRLKVNVDKSGASAGSQTVTMTSVNSDDINNLFKEGENDE